MLLAASLALSLFAGVVWLMISVRTTPSTKLAAEIVAENPIRPYRGGEENDNLQIAKPNLCPGLGGNLPSKLVDWQYSTRAIKPDRWTVRFYFQVGESPVLLSLTAWMEPKNGARLLEALKERGDVIFQTVCDTTGHTWIFDVK